VTISLPPGEKTLTSSPRPRDLVSRGKQPVRARTLPGEISTSKAETTEVVYHYRVLSKDTFDNLAISGDHTLTVPVEDNTPPVITNLVVSSVTDTSAQIQWETDEPTSAILQYGLGAGDYAWSLEDTAMTMTHQFNLMELLPVTEYHYKASSADVAGNWSVTPDSILVTKSPLPKQPGKPEHYDD
jgi:hypothetical protein